MTRLVLLWILGLVLIGAGCNGSVQADDDDDDATSADDDTTVAPDDDTSDDDDTTVAPDDDTTDDDDDTADDDDTTADEVVTPTGHPAEGRDFLRDLAAATITAPPGMDSLASQYLTDVSVVFHVHAVDEAAGEIDIYGAMLEQVGGQLQQNLCSPTWNLASAGAGTYKEPFFSIGPADVEIGFDGSTGSAYGLITSGRFTAGWDAIVAGEASSQLDTRMLDELIDPNADEGAACELLASLAINCQPCPYGLGPFCLQMAAEGIVSTEVGVYGIDPETGAQYSTLTRVTPAQVAAWEAGGFCP
jgi:hypothetical protein